MQRSKAASGARRSAQSGREKILSAARTLFAERAFEAVSTREIALKAGVSLPLIHHHFASKDELKREVDARIVEETRRIFEANAVSHAQEIATGNVKTSAPVMKEVRALIPHVRRLMHEQTDEGRELFELFAKVAKFYREELQKYGKISRAVSVEEFEEALMIFILGPVMLDGLYEKRTGVSLYELGKVTQRRKFYSRLIFDGVLKKKEDPQ